MDPRDFMHKGQLAEDEIYNYILQNLEPERMEKIKDILKSSKIDFLNYVSLREAIHLMKKGEHASVSLEKHILGLVKEKSEKSHIQILVRILKDKVLISSSDQEILNYQGIMTNFSIRGSSPGPISITRKFDDNDITLSLSPTADNQGYLLNVSLLKSLSYSVILYVNQEEWEVIRDISNKSNFESILPPNCEIELRFKQKSELLHVIGLILSSEG